MNLRRIAAVARKELREVVRDRLFFALAFLVPPVLLLIMGFGVVLDVESIPLAILDHDRSVLSREYAHRFQGSRYFALQGYLSSEREILPLLTRERVRVVIAIPDRFQERLLAGRSAEVQTIIDGSRPSRAETTGNYVTAINSAFSSERVIEHLADRYGVAAARARALVQPVSLDVRYLYNDALRSSWALAPGFMMLVLMMTPPLLTAVGIVREKETGSIDNVYASTVGKAEFLLGKLIPYAVISSLVMLLLWAIVLETFDVPFRGDPLLFFGAAVAYVLCTTSLGLVISLLVRTQIAAVLVTVVVTMVPTILYSGIVTPVSSLSAAGQKQSLLIPGTYFNRIVQGAFLKGVGVDVLGADIVSLLTYSAMLFLVAWGRFSKRPSS